MLIMTDAPAAVSRLPLPHRPVPHEKTPDRPTPSNPRPHPQGSAVRTAGSAVAHLARLIGAAA